MTSPHSEIYLGLMSGTSMNSLDCCAVRIDEHGRLELLGRLSKDWPPNIRAALHALCQSGSEEIEHLGISQNAVGAFSALLVRELLQELNLSPSEVRAVGSHGQTVRHRPERGFTLQLDNAPLCALLTGIDVWSDFRRQDVAASGQGAPLTPLFHQCVFAAPDELRCVLNLGGIANLTVLRPGGEIVVGFDTGPANTLIDLACRELIGKPYDEDGAMARIGQVRQDWLQLLCSDPYFFRRPPKSCGRELFNAAYISFMLREGKANPKSIPDIIATLTAFTVTSIEAAFTMLRQDPTLPSGGTVILCGGGAANTYLCALIEQKLGRLNLKVRSSSSFGIDPFLVEAEAFAYFAYLSSHGRTVDLGRITGSNRKVILGTLSPAPGGWYQRTLQQLDPYAQVTSEA